MWLWRTSRARVSILLRAPQSRGRTGREGKTFPGLPSRGGSTLLALPRRRRAGSPQGAAQGRALRSSGSCSPQPRARSQRSGLSSHLPPLGPATAPSSLPQALSFRERNLFLFNEEPLRFLGQLMGHLTLSCAEEDQEISCGAAQALRAFHRFILLRQSKRRWGGLGPSRHKGPGKAPHRLLLPLLAEAAAKSSEAGAGEQPCRANHRAHAARLGAAAWGPSREPLGWRACGSSIPGLLPSSRAESQTELCCPPAA